MRLSIVIPAYNEGHHLDAVVRRLHAAIRRAEPDSEIVIVNNGSSDNTEDVARGIAASLPGVRLERVSRNEGYGNGILRGLAAARGEVLGWAHADEQANPEDIVRVYRMLNEGSFDLCKAVRVERHESFWRRVQSVAYNMLFRRMFNVPYRDINGTPKLLTRALYERINLDSKDWYIDPEAILKTRDAGGRIGEVDIVWQTRKSGSSNVHLYAILQFIKRMLQSRFARTPDKTSRV